MTAPSAGQAPFGPPRANNPLVQLDIKVTDTEKDVVLHQGRLRIELRADVVPKTARNFMYLVNAEKVRAHERRRPGNRRICAIRNRRHDPPPSRCQETGHRYATLRLTRLSPVGVCVHRSRIIQ